MASTSSGAGAGAGAAVAPPSASAAAAPAEPRTLQAVMSTQIKELLLTQGIPGANLLRRLEMKARREDEARGAQQKLELKQRKRRRLEEEIEDLPRKDTRRYANLCHTLETTKRTEAKAETSLAKAQRVAEQARAALAEEEEDKLASGLCGFFEPLAPKLLQQAAGCGGGSGGGRADPATTKSKSKRTFAETAAASPLLGLLECEDLASHLFAFLPSRSALRLGSTCRPFRALVDDGVSNVTITRITTISEATSVARLATRFPRLDSLTINFGRLPSAVDAFDFGRHLAQDTKLPTCLKHLTMIGLQGALLDGLLAADWPVLQCVETDDVADFLSRLSRAQQRTPALLAGLRTLGFAGHTTRRLVTQGLIKLAAALSAGAFSTPPALSSISCMGDIIGYYNIGYYHPYHPPAPDGGLRALGAILTAVPAVNNLSLHLKGYEENDLAPVLQAMQPNHGAFQQLRSLTVVTHHDVILGPFLSALGTLGVAPNLISLSLDLKWWAWGSLTQPPPLLAAGAWPRLTSLRLPAHGFSDNPRGALTAFFCACGPGLESLDLSCSERQSAHMDPLAVIADEAVAIAWRDSLRSLILPSDSSHKPERTQAPIAKTAKEALLRLPNLTRLGVCDGGLGVTVGWLEAKEAGGLARLKEVDYGNPPYSSADEKALFLLVAWLKKQFKEDPVAASALVVSGVKVKAAYREKLRAIGLPTLRL